MANVQRGNVFLTVSEEQVEKYLSKGYSLVDEFGRVIRQSVPTELGELQKAFSEHTALLKQKDAEIASLKAEIQELKSAGEKKSPAGKSKLFNTEEESTEENGWDDWADAEEVEEKPKKTKKSK